MVTAYTGGIDISAFMAQYNTGVYRYRVLGREILLHLYYFLASRMADKKYLLPRDTSGSFLLYGAFAILNGFYLLLSNVLLLSLLWIKRKGIADRELSFYLYYTLLLALSLAVVTPYDQLAYLILLVGFFSARVKSHKIGVLLVVISGVAGTLNRETEFLFASFLFTLALFSRQPRSNRYWIYLAIDLALSFGAYICIRLLIPGKVQIIQGITFGGKWAIQSCFVLALLIAASVVLALRIYNDVLPAAIFLISSIPYFFTIFVGGVFRELRLIVPIVLCILCLYVILARTNENIRYISSEMDAV